MTPHRSAVHSATSAALNLMNEIQDDLDIDQGGIIWWRGYVGWKVSAELGEYLLSACSGVAEAMIKASLAVKEHGEVSFARDDALVRAWRQIGERGGSLDEMLGAHRTLGDAGQRREDRIDAWSEQTIVSLAQALDRAAAVVIIVAGINQNVIRTDWGKLESLAIKAPNNGPHQGLTHGKLADAGTDGRERQNAVLSYVSSASDHGPTDWLPWLIKQRNTMVHRAPRLVLQQMIGSRRQATGIIKPFPRQPDWVGTRAMIEASKTGLGSMSLDSAPQNVLEGLRGSVSTLLTALLEQSRELWLSRRADPSLIIQPGSSWNPLSKTAVLDFPGYGDPAPAQTSEIYLHPSLARRLRAARLTDEQVHLWDE